MFENKNNLLYYDLEINSKVLRFRNFEAPIL